MVHLARRNDRADHFRCIAEEKELVTSDLPVKRVVMFNSVVAFYEHQGEVEGNAMVGLKFNVRDINNLLKSVAMNIRSSCSWYARTKSYFSGIRLISAIRRSISPGPNPV